MTKASNTPSVFLSDPDVTLWHGDALETLREMPDESVHCIATSPPFYALRDYGTGRWEGGEHEHAHDRVGARGGRGGSGTLDKRSADAMPATVPAGSCSCGAVYVDDQIGLEDTPEEWAVRLVEVFAEARRVLRKDGTLWVECGDSYNSGTSARRKASVDVSHGGWENGGEMGDERINVAGLKAKDLLLTPFVLAFALRADGWWLRGCNIWAKPNAMPESAKDRCTTAHSYVFQLSRSARYYFDGDAISEPAAWERWGDQTVPKHEGTETAAGWMQPKTKHELAAIGGRTTNGQKSRTDERRGFDNRLERVDGMKHPRSVWTIPTQGFPEAHFATWPEALARRIILAGCPADGTVLDPFAGSGTTLYVARKLGRRGIGIDLNAEYLEMAARRLAQQSLLAEAAS